MLRCTFLAATLIAASAFGAVEPGFTPIFNGKNLDGWKLMDRNGAGYGVKDGVVFCEHGGGGNLFTEKEYENFVLRFEFRLEPGSNNGIGIRAPYEGDAAYMGMEIQVLDDTTKKYGPLQPWQHHGAIYNIVAPKVGFQKPVGEWNQEEITADGRHIKVVLNGHTIVDANLNDVTNPETFARHPGMLRPRGHIGFLGHNDYVEFRNLRVKELPAKHKDNTPPTGFTALFNGKNLKGWKGSVGSPKQRASMSPDELASTQKKADEDMKQHWRVEDGAIAFDGKGKNLVTAKDYANFELWVDWKITKDGDSGIYLRGCPQVQIWDPASKHGKRDHSVGSGGIHNNTKNPNVPSKRADKPIGEWNHFQILLVGDKVTVYLNDELVVNNVTYENSVEPGKPLYPLGPIELQNHKSPLWFKNIYVREIKSKK
jgi:hypothetical protein